MSIKWFRYARFTGAAIGAFLIAAPAQAVISYDQNVTPDVIFGSGNANGAYTVDRSAGIELGLRGKLRFDSSNQPQNTFNSNGDGTYSFAAGTPPTGFGFAPGSPTTPVWNFEWSINTDQTGLTGLDLDDLNYELGIDFDPGIGTNYQTFDPINVTYADHSIGDNSTPNGGGAEAPSGDSAAYQALIENNNVAQNSWNMEFFNDAPFDSFDPNVDGQYDFYLTAFDGLGNEVASVNMAIIVGDGAQVPAPAGALLLGFGLAALGLLRRRRNS